MQALNMGGSIKICKFPPPPKKIQDTGAATIEHL